MDHWLDWIIVGFITEFAVDTTVRWNDASSKDHDVSISNLWTLGLRCYCVKNRLLNKLIFGTTGSGKIYRNESTEELETSPLISPLRESKEELVKVSPRIAVSLIRQQVLRLPPPPTPPPISPSSPSLPTPPLPPPQCSMSSAIKLLVFRGVRNEDLDHSSLLQISHFFLEDELEHGWILMFGLEYFILELLYCQIVDGWICSLAYKYTHLIIFLF